MTRQSATVTGAKRANAHRVPFKSYPRDPRSVRLGECGDVIIYPHCHHSGCQRCGITVEHETEAAARQWAITHGQEFHGLPESYEPARTNAICTLCAIASVN